MPELKQETTGRNHEESPRYGYAVGATAFKAMHAVHEQHESMIEEVLHERHGLGAEALEEVPKILGKAAIGIALAVELKPVVVAAWHGDAIKTEEELLKAIGSIGGMTLGMVAGGAAGSVTPGVGNVIGGIAGGVLGAHYGEKLMENLTEEMHKEYGENNTIAMGMLRHAYAKLEPHITEAYHAAQHGIEKLEHPTAQALLDHTREAHQQHVAQNVARLVDVNLAAPVLNTMQTLGSAQTVVEADRELRKLGPVSEVTYGKAAADMAAVLTMGEKLTPLAAADVLEKASAGHVVPHFDIQSTAALTDGRLSRQAENGNVGAQYALLSQSSLIFSPRNDAASSRLQFMVDSELRKDGAQADWKALESSLQASNQQLASRSSEVLTQATTPKLDRPVQYEAPHPALER